MNYRQMNLFDEREEKKLRLFREASLANLTALQENVRHLMMSAICGTNTSGSFAKLTQGGLWQRMYGDSYQVRMDGSLDEFLGTWLDGGGRVWWYCFPSSAAGTAFQGDRVAIVAASNGIGWGGVEKEHEIRSDEKYLEFLGAWKTRQNNILSHMGRPYSLPERRHMRNDDGLSEQVDRFRSIGNSVVPSQFYPIFKTIAEIETGQMRFA